MLFKALNNREKREKDSFLLNSHKTKRSQSALEYMMTYGWAILIIVIVAVILYSMGIFNPSSSITFTSSGFSPFTVSSSLCNNIGYKIAVLAGPIPNNGNSLTINKVFLTSATGANTTTASYTLTNPVTLKSGQSATILIPNVACNSANIHYSLSAKIQYSYDVPTIGLQTVNTTGTVAGTSITGKPSTLTSYEPITITNTQSSATPSPFQQMINFTSSDPGFSSIATGNFGQNVEFFYYNGTIIPSWLENYTSTNGLWWLKIAVIPGGSSETVYVGFAPISISLFNTVNDGEAPQIPCGSTPTSSCSNYAEYDDGANVFNFYDNFAGTTLNTSKWTATGTYSINNGILIKNSSSSYLTSTDSYGSGVIDFYAQFLGTPHSGGGINSYGGYSNGQQDGRLIGTFGEDGNCNTVAASTPEFYLVNFQGCPPVNLTQIASFNNNYNVFSVASTNSEDYGYINYGNAVSSTSDLVSLPYPVGVYVNTAGQSINMQWFRFRAYPPNGVMPSVSFGSVA